MDRRGGQLRPLWAVRLTALVVATGLTLVASAAGAETVSSVKLAVVRTGVGSVNGIDNVILCGERCVGRFSRGGLVFLRAEATPPGVFIGWSGACVGTSPVCVLAMDANRRVRAAFGARPRLVRVTVARGGTTTSVPRGLMCGSAGGVCGALFAVGSTVALTKV